MCKNMNRNNIQDKLSEYVKRELLRNPGYPLEDDEPLISGGLIDSFAIAQISVFIEKEFNVFIPNASLTVENMDTVAKMTSTIARWVK